MIFEKEGFANLTKELSEAFKPHGLLLTAAVTADPSTADVVYDISVLSNYVDWFNLISYDNRCSFDGKTGQNIPIVDHNLDIRASIDHWAKNVGAPEKLVLGMISYGWINKFSDKFFAYISPPVFARSHRLNTTQTGSGEDSKFCKYCRSFPFKDICERIKSNHGWNIVRNPRNEMGLYAYNNGFWVAFDDVENIRIKAKLICEMHLGGGVLLALDYDDFEGSCGCGKYPLITALNQEMRAIGGTPVQNCP